jgi:lysozyme
MKLDVNGYLLITKFEGFSATPYLCSAGIPTIGYGSTFYVDGAKVTMKDIAISETQALVMFKAIADEFAAKVLKLLKKTVNQHQFNTLVSFAYNCGLNNLGKSTLLKKVNINPDDPAIRYEFLKWNKAKGKIIVGLTRRRNEEARIYFS